MLQVTLYTRQDCHLCEQVKADLESLKDRFPHQLAEIDVDSSPQLRKAFGLEVPVVEIGPYTLKAPVAQSDLALTLAAAQDRLRHIAQIEQEAELAGSVRWTKSDRFTHWISNHYLALLNFLVLLYVGLPVLAPVLMNAGYTAPANVIYRLYSGVCHQLAFRSYFLFGEQAVYPRAEAGLESVMTLQQATGLDESAEGAALLAARRYVGNEQVGYKIALCERDIFIYGAILLFGLIYAATGRKLPPLPWYLWVGIGMLPIGLDGFSQLLSQPPLNLFPYRESTPFLRSLTGFLFGFTTAWFGYPMVEASMAEARQIMATKLRRIAHQSATPR
ncbi:MAG TPA: DUF2085 domain-containing protein [Anaerolineales bacterium]|nr:DUF2085 domain-containing protein [Anaerolineales bacterium]